jgi:hypothetical protein
MAYLTELVSSWLGYTVSEKKSRTADNYYEEDYYTGAP